MILELLIIIFLLWLFTRGPAGPAGPSVSSQPQDLEMTPPKPLIDPTPKLEELRSILNQISTRAQLNPTYTLSLSSTTSYVVDKSHIYLVVVRPDGSFYDQNTLVHAAVHELSHIVCPQEDHPPIYDVIEKYLLGVAQDLQVYDPTKPLDSTYPCHN